VKANADKFASENGGKVFKFADITPEMADLCGGGMPDSKM
jgi:nitrous oxide reductase accessory protein NosL